MSQGNPLCHWEKDKIMETDGGFLSHPRFGHHHTFIIIFQLASIPSRAYSWHQFAFLVRSQRQRIPIKSTLHAERRRIMGTVALRQLCFPKLISRTGKGKGSHSLVRTPSPWWPAVGTGSPHRPALWRATLSPNSHFHHAQGSPFHPLCHYHSPFQAGTQSFSCHCDEGAPSDNFGLGSCPWQPCAGNSWLWEGVVEVEGRVQGRRVSPWLASALALKLDALSGPFQF